jgi:hypothetical protein
MLKMLIITKKITTTIVVLCFCFTYIFAQTATEREIKSEYLAAEKAFNANDYESTITHLREAIKIGDGVSTPAMQYMLTKACFKAKHYNDAQVALNQYFDLAPDETKDNPAKYREMVEMIAIIKSKKQEESAKQEHEALIKAEKIRQSATVEAIELDSKTPEELWGGEKAGVYGKIGVGVPLGDWKNPPSNTTTFRNYNNTQNFGAQGAGINAEIGMCMFFYGKNTPKQPVRFGFDATFVHLQVIPRTGFGFTSPSNDLIVYKMNPLIFLGTQIGPAIGFRLGEGTTLRLAYQVAPMVMLGGDSPTKNNQYGTNLPAFVDASITQSSPQLNVLGAASATLKIKSLTINFKYVTGEVPVSYTLYAADKSYSNSFSILEKTYTAPTIGYLSTAIGLSF